MKRLGQGNNLCTCFVIFAHALYDSASTKYSYVHAHARSLLPSFIPLPTQTGVQAQHGACKIELDNTIATVKVLAQAFYSALQPSRFLPLPASPRPPLSLPPSLPLCADT